MRLTASDFYSYFRPAKCDLRVYLRHHGEAEAPPSPYEEVLLRLAERHEKTHLQTFPEVLDLSSFPWKERWRRTVEAVRDGVAVVYQGSLRATVNLNGVPCEVVGDPDFLIKAGDGYIIRDSKLSKRINDKDHPEIIYQVQLYGWLYEQTFRRSAKALEVHSGPGDIIPITYDGGQAALRVLAEILKLKQKQSEFYSPVGWAKCSGCGFFERCWRRAEGARDVALVSEVDQGLARTLHEMGIRTVDDLVGLSEHELSQIERPWGWRRQKVGKRATGILRAAAALASGNELLLQPPAIPDHPNYVMFDLEGMPPHLDELEKIYLWGVQVYGDRPSSYEAALAEPGADGDRQGWEQFLQIARRILVEYGDLPFVHWHHYERTKLDLYIQRFGDPDGTAARVQANLLDLLPITRQAIVLPIPSYSLKVVERYIGFRRQRPEANGEWAIAKYIEAIETEDPQQHDELIDEIRAYNQEDLEAMWAVLRWLKDKNR